MSGSSINEVILAKYLASYPGLEDLAIRAAYWRRVSRRGQLLLTSRTLSTIYTSTSQRITDTEIVARYSDREGDLTQTVQAALMRYPLIPVYENDGSSLNGLEWDDGRTPVAENGVIKLDDDDHVYRRVYYSYPGDISFYVNDKASSPPFWLYASENPTYNLLCTNGTLKIDNVEVKTGMLENTQYHIQISHDFNAGTITVQVDNDTPVIYAPSSMDQDAEDGFLALWYNVTSGGASTLEIDDISIEYHSLYPAPVAATSPTVDITTDALGALRAVFRTTYKEVHA